MTFWLSAAPTPARTKAQRLATQIEDEVIATPSAPVSGSSAAIEKVMAGTSASRAGGITAITSISTSHSGRASADTTSPVETGNTPFSHLPTAR